MDAKPLTVNDIFFRDRRHLVPLFQRPYVWNERDQWQPLWHDIQRVAARQLEHGDARPHFLGAVVLEQMRTGSGSVECRQVIDGQQRLTTIQLFLEAFCDLCRSIGEDRITRALEKLTRNEDPMSTDANEQYKIWPTNVDRDVFCQVMDAPSPTDLLKAFGHGPSTARTGKAIADAYLYFYKELSEWIRPLEAGVEDRARALLHAVREMLRLVVIDLGENDEAQLIFETLNARGTPLLPADLIKNSLFHRAIKQGLPAQNLYERFWKPFDEDADYWRGLVGRGHAQRSRIDLFLQYFLTARTGDEVEIGHLHPRFLEYANASFGSDVTPLLDEVSRYALRFQAFDNRKRETREGLFFRRLSAMDVSTAYPFLLQLYVEHGDDPQAIQEVLEDLESFLVRRMVCQLSTRAYNRFFIELLKASISPGGTIQQRVRDYLLSSDSESGRWPGDKEFEEAWLTVPVYRVLVRGRVRMLLEGLELALHTKYSEKIEFGDYLHVEHLLPRSWETHWPPPDVDPATGAADRSQLLHTIGNLSLLTKSLNPAVSNGAWASKRPAIDRHSRLLLNRWLPNEWGDDAIRARSADLFKVGRNVWAHPADRLERIDGRQLCNALGNHCHGRQA